MKKQTHLLLTLMISMLLVGSSHALAGKKQTLDIFVTNQSGHALVVQPSRTNITPMRMIATEVPPNTTRMQVARIDEVKNGKGVEVHLLVHTNEIQDYDHTGLFLLVYGGNFGTMSIAGGEVRNTMHISSAHLDTKDKEDEVTLEVA